MPYEEIEHEGCTYRPLPGYSFGVTSTAIVHRFRLPSRYKAGGMERIQAIEKGIIQGLI